MTQIERFNSNLKTIAEKFNKKIILLDDREPIKRKEKVKWLCIQHNIEFESTIDILLNNTCSCGCPECKKEKLIYSGLKGVQKKKELKDN